jgi:tetratricopeptide (TPR) repeat protein
MPWQDVLYNAAGKHSDAAVSIDRLDEAFQAAGARRDAVTQMALSAHAMAFIVLDWSRFNGWQTWVERFDSAERALLDDDCDWESSFARATGALARALLTGQPLAITKPLAVQLQSMLRAATTAQQATHNALAGAVLLPVHQMANALSDAQVLHVRMTETWSRWHAANDATQLFSLLWFAAWAQHIFLTSPTRLPEALAEFDAALHAAPKDAVSHGAKFRRARLATDQALYQRDDALLDRELLAMLTALHPDRPMEQVIYNAQAASLAMRRKDTDAALNHLEHMNRALEAAHCPAAIASAYHVREGGVYFAMGRYGLAAQAMEAASRCSSDSHRVVTLGYVSLARGLEAFEQSGSTRSVSPQCATFIRDGLAAMRRTTTHGFFFTAPKERGIVCAIALSEEIESEFVREGLKQVPVPPPIWADDHWPWAISVRSFGGFRMQATLAEGQRADKASSRPLLLLKLIVAHGEKGVPVSTAMDALWPDQDGDQAEHALTVTLQRLRKFFVEEDLILRNDGWLTLNAEKVWTDVRALEVHLEAMSSAVIEPVGSSAVNEAQLLQLVRRLFDLYRGDCLHGVDEPWAADRVAHYRTRVTHMLRQYVSHANRTGQTALLAMLASRATEHGIEVQ